MTTPLYQTIQSFGDFDPAMFTSEVARMRVRIDGYTGLQLIEQAQEALATDDLKLIAMRYVRLLHFHDNRHSPQRSPYLNCTGCAIWPVIREMRAYLGLPNDI